MQGKQFRMGDYGLSQNSLCVAFKTEELNFNVLIVEVTIESQNLAVKVNPLSLDKSLPFVSLTVPIYKLGGNGVDNLFRFDIL